MKLKDNIKRHLYKDSKPWRLLSAYIFFLHRLFYKRIVVEGLENLPEHGPLIFAPNHQNALMDPLAVLYATSRQVVFLARADIFRHPWLRRIFLWMKILPVYRIRDGKNNLNQNEQSFEIAVEVLEHGAPVGIFPEAAHSNKWSLLPLKKGVPRLAFLAEEKNAFGLGLKIVPVGIFYSEYESMGSILHVRFGEPIRVKDFEENFRTSPQKAHLELRDAIREGLQPLTINVTDQARYTTYKILLDLHAHTFARKLIHTKDRVIRSFEARKKLIAALDQLRDDSPEQMQELADKLEQLRSRLLNNQLDISLVSRKKPGLLRLLLLALPAMLGLPVFLYGLINHLPAYMLVKRLIRRFKDRQFHSSVKFLWGAFVLPLFYLLQTAVVCSLTKGNWPAVLYLLSLPLTGVFARWYSDSMRVYKMQWRFLMLKHRKPAEYHTLSELSDEIGKNFDAFFSKKPCG
jgi:1-acyl-sn-glycerol-3-phosphate acyltransferase